MNPHIVSALNRPLTALEEGYARVAARSVNNQTPGTRAITFKGPHTSVVCVVKSTKYAITVLVVPVFNGFYVGAAAQNITASPGMARGVYGMITAQDKTAGNLDTITENYEAQYPVWVADTVANTWNNFYTGYAGTIYSSVYADRWLTPLKKAFIPRFSTSQVGVGVVKLLDLDTFGTKDQTLDASGTPTLHFNEDPLYWTANAGHYAAYGNVTPYESIAATTTYRRECVAAVRNPQSGENATAGMPNRVVLIDFLAQKIKEVFVTTTNNIEPLRVFARSKHIVVYSFVLSRYVPGGISTPITKGYVWLNEIGDAHIVFRDDIIGSFVSAGYPMRASVTDGGIAIYYGRGAPNYGVLCIRNDGSYTIETTAVAEERIPLYFGTGYTVSTLFGGVFHLDSGGTLITSDLSVEEHGFGAGCTVTWRFAGVTYTGYLNMYRILGYACAPIQQPDGRIYALAVDASDTNDAGALFEICSDGSTLYSDLSRMTIYGYAMFGNWYYWAIAYQAVDQYIATETVRYAILSYNDTYSTSVIVSFSDGMGAYPVAHIWSPTIAGDRVTVLAKYRSSLLILTSAHMTPYNSWTLTSTDPYLMCISIADVDGLTVLYSMAHASVVFSRHDTDTDNVYVTLRDGSVDPALFKYLRVDLAARTVIELAAPSIDLYGIAEKVQNEYYYEGYGGLQNPGGSGSGIIYIGEVY